MTESEKWRNYLDQKAEFRSEESLNAYYRRFEGTGDHDEQQMVEFWKTTLYEYTMSVEHKFGLRVDDLMKRFTLHDRIPNGLPAIMRELALQKSMASRDDILTGAFFGKNVASDTPSGGKRAMVAGMARYVASGLYNRTFGYLFGGGSDTGTPEGEDAETDVEYVCVEYLERQANIFTRWALKNENTLMSRAQAKLNLQKTTQHSLDDIELLLMFMEHSGRVLVERVGAA